MVRISAADLTRISTLACPTKVDHRGSFRTYWKYDSVDLATHSGKKKAAKSKMAGVANPPADAAPAIHHVDVPDYPAAHSPYSHAVVANGFVFVSGQIPVKPGGGPTEIVGDTMQEQTRQALRNVQTVLKAAGSSLDRVVKVTVLLARPDLYKEMNEAYAEFFPGAKPVRAMVRFGADIPGVLVAIAAIALA
jgi:2-iminobutanoate/2-iminopropanoate deaminase